MKLNSVKSLILASALCLGGTTFLGAKTRTFTIDKPVMIGSYNVAPGTYRMRVTGNTAEITELNHFADKKPVEVTASVSKGDEKFSRTVVKAVNDGDTDRVTEIDLSHSHDTVTFNQ